MTTKAPMKILVRHFGSVEGTSVSLPEKEMTITDPTYPLLEPAAHGLGELIVKSGKSFDAFSAPEDHLTTQVVQIHSDGSETELVKAIYNKWGTIAYDGTSRPITAGHPCFKQENSAKAHSLFCEQGLDISNFIPNVS